MFFITFAAQKFQEDNCAQASAMMFLVLTKITAYPPRKNSFGDGAKATF